MKAQAIKTRNITSQLMKRIKKASYYGLLYVIAALLTLAITNPTRAQVTNATPKWKAAFPNKPEFLRYVTNDGEYVVGTNTANAAVLDGKTGDLLWSSNFEKLLGTKKCDLQYSMDEAGVLFLYRSRGSSNVLHTVDLKTGEELWSTDQFQNLNLNSIIYLPELKSFILVTKNLLHMVEARTGKELWNTSKFRGSVAYSKFDAQRKEVILLNYKTSWGALLSGFKNQIMSVNAETGEVNWEQEYFGVIHENLHSGRPVFEMMLDEDKIYLMVMGLQVLDRNTGKELWKTTYDLYDQKANFGTPGYTTYYNGIAYPLIADDAVYLVYNKLASAKVAVQKLDKATGKELWEYKVEGRNNPVPKLQLVDGKVLLQLGGRIQVVAPQKIGTMVVYTSKYKWDGRYGVVALDAVTGDVVWEFTKLANRMTNIEVSGDKVFFADAKTLYAANIADGQITQSVDIKALKCGNPFEVLHAGNTILCVGEKGMGGVSTSTLAVDWAVPLAKTGENSRVEGSHYLLRGEKLMHVVNVSNGKISASYKYAKGHSFGVINNGNTFVLTGPKEAMRFDF